MQGSRRDDDVRAARGRSRLTSSGSVRASPGDAASLLRGACKALALAFLVIAIVPTQSVLLLLRLESAAARWGQLWHRAVCQLLGLHIECCGEPIAGAQVAYVGNHLSYLDIPVVGSRVWGSFTAKREMREWPVFGLLAQLQRTVFISRDRRDAGRVAAQIDALLASGRNLILFPEGTSSPGMRVLPFKSSVFSVLDTHLAHGLRIQPFTIDLQCVDGTAAIGVEIRDVYAYYADMRLASHLWRFLQTRCVHVRLVFHPALALAPGTDRKQLAKLAEACVATGLAQPPNCDAGEARRDGDPSGRAE